MNPHTRIKFKILVLGEAGVGKSSLVRRFADNLFNDQHHLTIGIDFKTCPMVVAGYKVNLQIWDTAGEERFRAVMPVYYRNAQGILLVYDTTWGISFRCIAHWLQEIRANCPRDINILMVGNKCDELKERQITGKQATRYAAFCGLPILETSAKTGDGVKEVFATMALSIFNRLVPTPLTLLGPSGKPYQDRLKTGEDLLQVGQDRLKVGEDRLKVGENRLEAGQDLLQAEQDRLKVGEDRLETGQDLLQAGQDLLQPGQDHGYVEDRNVQPQHENRICLRDNKNPGMKRILGSCCL